jgi:hypothetical protein
VQSLTAVAIAASLVIGVTRARGGLRRTGARDR